MIIKQHTRLPTDREDHSSVDAASMQQERDTGHRTSCAISDGAAGEVWQHASWRQDWRWKHAL
jgi:hypothetical protein